MSPAGLKTAQPASRVPVPVRTAWPRSHRTIDKYETMNNSADITSSRSTSLALRYGGDSVPAAGPWNAHLDLLLSHRSVRGYRPDPLPEGTLETLIAAAQSAATSSNLQTWSVIAVTDPDAKAQLAAASNNQRHIEQCPLFLVWLADLSRNERLGAQENTDLETIPYLETFLVAAIDAALAAQNAVIAAESGMDLETARASIETMEFPSIEEQLSEAWLGGNAASFMKGVADVFVTAGSIDSALDSYEDAVNTGPLEAAKGM